MSNFPGFTGLSSHAHSQETAPPYGAIGFHRVEKVKLAISALHTTQSEAISNLLGLDREEVIWVIGCLEDTGWNVAEAIARDSDCQLDNHQHNRAIYVNLRDEEDAA